MLSPEYMAGLIDGEGSFFVICSNGVYSPCLGVISTDDQIMYLLADSIETYIGVDINVQVVSWHERHRNHKTSYRIYVYGGRLRDFIPVILPYLIIKRRQAEACLQLAQMIGTNHHTNKLTLEECESRKELAGYITELNSSGGERYIIRQPAHS